MRSTWIKNLVFLTGAVLLGFGAGYFLHGNQNVESDQAMDATLRLMESVNQASISAATLHRLESEGVEAAARLQTTWLTFQLEFAHEQLEKIKAVDFPLPNAAEAARRVEEFTAGNERIRHLHPEAKAIYERVSALHEAALRNSEDPF